MSERQDSYFDLEIWVGARQGGGYPVRIGLGSGEEFVGELSAAVQEGGAAATA